MSATIAGITYSVIARVRMFAYFWKNLNTHTKNYKMHSVCKNTQQNQKWNVHCNMQRMKQICMQILFAAVNL